MKAFEKIQKILENAGAHLLPPEAIGVIDDGSGCAYQIGQLRAIASWGGGWDHLSISAGWGPRGPTRIPTYVEMESMKRIFFEEHEAAFQIHPPLDQYVNVQPFCLHLWRPQGAEIPLPPKELVG